MAGHGGPVLVLIDCDPERRARIAATLQVLGVACDAFDRLPSMPVPAIAQVLLAGPVDAALVTGARTRFPQARIIAASADRSQAAVIAALRAGTDDFVCLDQDDSELARVLAAGAAQDPGSPEPDPAASLLVGDSAPMRQVRAFIRKLAASEATVLVTGETGTGKDCAALLLHRLGRRAGGPLVALNCAAIPEALLEGELFGYERGAFSGAVASYPGKLKLADRGTLLLDEIGELSLAGQAKLLRALETREVFRLGARAPVRFDVRIVAATNRDLAQEVAAGRFRADLFYRIAVAHLGLPPLREHAADVGAIAAHVLRGLDRAPLPRIDAAAVARLQAHDWPGNVRELRNVLEVALLQGDGLCIRVADLPLAGTAHPPRAVPPPAATHGERQRLEAALAAARGNKSLAAQALNCSRMTLYRRLARCGIGDAGASPVSHAVSHNVTQALSQKV